VGEEAPEVGAHHALPPHAVPLVELLQRKQEIFNHPFMIPYSHPSNQMRDENGEREPERRACRLDVAGDAAAVGDVEEVERAGGRRGRRGLHPRRHVRVLHPRLPLQHSPLVPLAHTAMAMQEEWRIRQAGLVS